MVFSDSGSAKSGAGSPPEQEQPLAPGQLWLGLAERTRTPDETLQFQSEKRVALHVTLAVVLAQCLTFIGWRNPPIAVAYIICAVTGAAVATTRLFLVNDYSMLRWVSCSAGLLFTIVHFVGEQCRLLERSGARYLTSVLPSVLFYVWMGGDVKTMSGVCGVHFILFVIFAIIEGSTTNTCYDIIYPPLTESPGGLTFVFAVLPLAVTVFGVVLVVSAQRIRSAGWAFTERMSADLARYIREHNFAGARSYIAAATSGRDAELSLCDLVMCAGITHAAMFEEISLVPVGEPGGAAIGAIKELRRDASSSPPSLSPARGDDDDRSARGVTLSGLASGLRRQSVGGGVGVSVMSDTGSHQSGAGGGTTPSSKYAARDLEGVSARDQHGGLRRRASAVSLHRATSMISSRRMSASDARAAGLSSVDILRGGAGQITVEPGFVLMITLPSFPMYAHRQQSTEMLRMLLGEYFDAVSQICDAFDGKIMFCCFTDIYIMFDQAASACAAALAIRHLLAKSAAHHRDLPFLELQPTRTLAVVFHTSVASSVVGTDRSAKLGACDGQILFEVVKARALRSSANLPLLLIASRLLPLVTKAFDVHRFEIPKFHRIGHAKDVNELGYPVLPVDQASPLKQHELDPPLVSEVIAEELLLGATHGGGAASSATAHDGGEGFHSGDGLAATNASMASAANNESLAATRPRLSPEILEVWRMYDTDRSGSLEISELRELMLDIGIEMNDDDMQRFFDDVDKDRSGSVSMDEFAKAFDRPMLAGFQMVVELRKKAQQMRIQNGIDNLPLVLAAWKRYDADGNGTLTANEIEKVLKDLGIAFPTQQHVEWFVEKFDQNGSGTIELDEFASLFSESTSNTQLNAAKARIETVTRVLSNKHGNMTYSTPKQDAEDALIRFYEIWVAYLSLPLFVYLIWNFGAIGYFLCLGEDTSLPILLAFMITDIIYYVWFALKMLYLPRKKQGQFILDIEAIRADYMTSYEFWIDVIVVLPLDFVYIGLGPELAGLYTLYRINKLFSMYHVGGLMNQIFSGFAPSNQSIVVALMWYFFISHIFACVYLLITRFYGDSYTTELSGWDSTITDRKTSYLQGILWALLTLAGQVKGNPVPTLDVHVALLFISVFVGIPLFGVLLGVVSTSVTTDTAETRFRSTIDALKGYFDYTALPPHLELACIDYYRHIFTTTGSLEIGFNPLADLPAELSVDVTIAIGSEMLRKVPIFADASENVEFVHELTSKMTTRIIEPGMRIMRKGERGSNMYFITYGEFHIINEENGARVWTLRKGNFFGEIALLQNVKRTATIVSDPTRFANVLVLEKRDFDQVASIFPECVTKIYQKAESRLKELRDKEAQEQRELKEKREKDAQQKDAILATNSNTEVTAASPTAAHTPGEKKQ